MFRNFWRKSGDHSKAEVENSPSHSSSVDYEAVLFTLLDEVERRSEFNRGWIRGFLEQRGVTREALAEWLRGFGERLQSGEEHQELGKRLLRLGRLDEGELCRVAGLIGRRLEQECRSQAPKEASAWFERGNECYVAGDFEGAIASYDKALEIKPDFDIAWVGRGAALHNLGQDEDAITSYDKALEIKPDDHNAWVNRGLSLANLGQDEDAIANYDKALEINPDDHNAWVNRGLSLANLGRDEDEIANYDKALEINPDDHAAWNNRGLSLHDLGRYEDAITNYDKALEINLDKSQAWYNRGISLDDLGRYEEAITSYDKALEIKPDDHLAWANRGISLHNLGQDEDAITSYDKALEIKPDDHLAWANRGISLHDLGQYEDAITSYDKALEIKPDDHLAWGNRAVAYCSLVQQGNFQTSLITAIQNSNLSVLDHVSALQEAIPHLSPETYEYAVLFSLLGKAYYEHSNSQPDPRVYWRNAVRSYKTALQILTAERHAEERLEALQGIMRSLLRLEEIETACTHCIEGAEIFRKLLNAQPTPFQKRNLEIKFSDFNRIAVDSLIAQGETIVALETAERYKNRCLTWILDEWKEQVISPSYAEMHQLLNPQTAIVYWHFSDESLTTFILTPTSEDPIVLENLIPYARSQKLQSWIKSWNTQYNDYRTKKANQADHSWRKALSTQLTKLKELLQIQTIESHLPNIQNLILLPHRDLHRFPLHALFSESLTITYLPSIQIGLNLKSRSSDRTSFLLNVEDPDRGNSMPFAQLESVILKAMFAPNAFSIPPEKSDRATVESALKTHHGIFHFTGHANYNDRKPENSELALKNSDTLTAKEISSLDLKNYHLVSLSACETALNGTQSIDTEYVGLTSAFLQAGVPHVISTLWTVEEASNAYLMIRFYQFWQAGQESAIALRSAQNWLRTCSNSTLAQWLKDLLPKTESDPGAQEYLRSCIQSIECKIDETDPPYRDPYYWAAFTHTGL
ncbi:MAG: tetratricopeptide repeat protein [Leptolyngbya sp. UWPOB_LEPTO1]|uniref:CHAT domain-containing protein n=1 Tax=Leptolyngbya sp. UWPOB_LEPTO1 TaxID=2815653 RepID=UPI001AC97BA5|nr:tetratricopeptide repeat protein [Leptolyngbya sp. UWPOB_LEPTO1]MBN8559596.1 tetratricopeptide repeat protein [Leptolyngbya sp. UWPOB_LEPTO1]